MLDSQFDFTRSCWRKTLEIFKPTVTVKKKRTWNSQTKQSPKLILGICQGVSKLVAHRNLTKTLKTKKLHLPFAHPTVGVVPELHPVNPGKWSTATTNQLFQHGSTEKTMGLAWHDVSRHGGQVVKESLTAQGTLSPTAQWRCMGFGIFGTWNQHLNQHHLEISEVSPHVQANYTFLQFNHDSWI